jgi:hypothetical protein
MIEIIIFPTCFILTLLFAIFKIIIKQSQNNINLIRINDDDFKDDFINEEIIDNNEIGDNNINNDNFNEFNIDNNLDKEDNLKYD